MTSPFSPALKFEVILIFFLNFDKNESFRKAFCESQPVTEICCHLDVTVAHASDFFLWNFQTVGLYYICLRRLGVPRPRIEPLQAIGTFPALPRPSSTRLDCHALYILYSCFIGLTFSPWELGSLFCIINCELPFIIPLCS